MFRHLGKRQRTRGGNDSLFVDFDARQIHMRRARGNDDVFRRKGFGFAAVRLDRNFAGSLDASTALQIIDLVLFEEEGDTLGQVADDLVLLCHHFGQIEGYLAELYAAARESGGGRRIMLRGLKQGFRRNAADVEAGSAEGTAHFDTGRLESQLGTANRTNVTARTAAYDDDIVCPLSHLVSFPSIIYIVGRRIALL